MPIVIPFRAQKIKEHGRRGPHRQYHEKPTAKSATVLQLSKSDAGILGVNEIQKSIDQGNVVTTAQPLHSPGLTNLIDQVDAEGQHRHQRH